MKYFKYSMTSLAAFCCCLSNAESVNTTYLDIVCEDSTTHLKEVIVKSRPIKREADKFVITIPPDKDKNMEELLRQAPGVFISSNDITINGANGTKIFIDDREVRLSGEELIEYIRSIPSQNIRKIEIQEMADASQSADSKGGIIRLYLRKRIIDGILGGITMDYHAAKSLQGYNPSAFFNLHSGKCDLFISTSSTFRPDNKGVSSASRKYSEADNQFTSNADISEPYKYNKFSVETIYHIDSTQNCGIETEYIHRSRNAYTNNFSNLAMNDYIMKSRGVYDQHYDYDTYSISGNYKKKLGNRGSTFKVLIDYISKHSKSTSEYNIFREWDNSDTIYWANASSTYNIASADVSLKHVMTNKSSLQIGLKNTLTSMTVQTKYKENISAAYMAYGTNWKKFSLDAGLRMEYTKVANNTNNINNEYIDLYPNINLTYVFDDIKRWMLSLRYSKNIERPGFYALDPTRFQSSEYSYSVGNPALKPTYINNISATVIFNYRYIISTGFRSNKNQIREFCEQDTNDPLITYMTYANHDRENHWFVYISAPFDITSWLRFATSITAVRQCIKTYKQDDEVGHNLIFANADINIRFHRNLSVELEYNAHNRLYSGNSEMSPLHSINISLKKKWMNNHLVTTLAVNNLLDKYEKYRTNLNVFTTNSIYNLASNGRFIKFAVAWNFNSGKQIVHHQLENSSDDERNRLNNTNQIQK